MFFAPMLFSSPPSHPLSNPPPKKKHVKFLKMNISPLKKMLYEYQN